MSHYITRRKRRQRWEAEMRNLIKTLQSNRELRYELGLLRSAGYQRAPIRWHGPDLHDSTFPIALTDQGARSLRVQEFANTITIDPDLVRYHKDPAWLRGHMRVKAVEDIADHLIKVGAVQQYTQSQDGHVPKHRIMWSCWVGVPA